MRLSVTMLLIAAVGMVVGAHLIGLWCVGLAVMVDSLSLGAWALLRDDDKNRKPQILSGVTEESRFISAVVDQKRHSA